MKKTLICAVAFSIVAAASIPAAYASPRMDGERFPHIDTSMQFPQGKMRNFRHTLRLYIPKESSALSQLIIDVPVGLALSNDITVADQSGRKIDANVSVNDNKVIVAFPQTVAPETQLNIHMNRVRRLGVSNAWLYHVAAKLVGNEADIPLGVAQFRVY